MYGKAASRGYKQVGKKTLFLNTLNGVKRMQTKLFEIPIVTTSGIRKVVCNSIDHPLTGKGAVISVDMIRKTFPRYKHPVRLVRKGEAAEILLGLDNFSLHPHTELDNVNNLYIKRGLLGDTIVGSIGNGSPSLSVMLSLIVSTSARRKKITGEDS